MESTQGLCHLHYRTPTCTENPVTELCHVASLVLYKLTV